MKTDRLYEPAMDETTRTKLLRGWHKAVAAVWTGRNRRNKNTEAKR